MEGTSLGHYCGIAGLFSPDPINLPEQLFFPLFALQHRGQESTGIAYRKEGRTVVYRDLGMVSAVLSRYLTRTRLSRVGIGHVRYSTRGGNKIENAQPLYVVSNKGEIALAHNGNLSNTALLKQKLFAEGALFQTSSDSELILHLLSRSRAATFEEALVEVLGALEGAYSIVLMHNDTLIALRDPLGFRPLYIGRKGAMSVVVSETCALDIMGIHEFRSVLPGEIVTIDSQGTRSTFMPGSAAGDLADPVKAVRQCIFELIYFARPDSAVFDMPVHATRKRMGQALAVQDRDLLRLAPNHENVVVAVPDSGNSAALGYAEAAGIRFDIGLTRNHYAGRSFIMPTTPERELAVRMKLNPVRDVVAGKRVFLVDDSLVRGTTAKILVSLLKEAGAAEVHIRLSSPELRWPCFFGIDIPTRSELISNSYSPAQIAHLVGADSVRFLGIEPLRTSVGRPNKYCYACFTGDYLPQVPLNEADRCFVPERGTTDGE